MNKMNLTLVTAMAACMGMTGCNGLKGTLTVDQNLTLVNKKGQTVVAALGQHDMELKVVKGGAELDLTIKQVAGKTQKLQIKLPAGQVLPQYRGELNIIGAQVGQAFDLRGALDTDTQSSPRIRTEESCTISYVEQQCRFEPAPGTVAGEHHPRMIRVCENVQINRPGLREVEYHTETTSTGVHANFLDSRTGVLLATFSGGKSSSVTINDFYGICR